MSDYLRSYHNPDGFTPDSCMRSRLRTLQTYGTFLDEKDALLRTKVNNKIEQLEAQIIADAPDAIIMEGRIGLQEFTMGLYTKQHGTVLNGAPLYAIKDRNSCVLGRSDTGCWCCSGSVESIQSGSATIYSEAPQSLPIGATFKFYDGQNMIRDPLITARSASPRTAGLELTAAFDKIGWSSIRYNCFTYY